MGKEKASTRAGGASSSTTGIAPTVRRAPHDEGAARARTSRSSSAAAEDVARSSQERSAVAALNALGRASRAKSAAMLAHASAAGTSTAVRGGGGEEVGSSPDALSRTVNLYVTYSREVAVTERSQER